jgi:hypothetical protein
VRSRVWGCLSRDLKTQGLPCSPFQLWQGLSMAAPRKSLPRCRTAACAAPVVLRSCAQYVCNVLQYASWKSERLGSAQLVAMLLNSLQVTF